MKVFFFFVKYSNYKTITKIEEVEKVRRFKVGHTYNDHSHI